MCSRRHTKLERLVCVSGPNICCSCSGVNSFEKIVCSRSNTSFLLLGSAPLSAAGCCTSGVLPAAGICCIASSLWDAVSSKLLSLVPLSTNGCWTSGAFATGGGRCISSSLCDAASSELVGLAPLWANGCCTSGIGVVTCTFIAILLARRWRTPPLACTAGAAGLRLRLDFCVPTHRRT